MAGHDVVVVGAGSGGAVVAGRLSEDPDRSVVLLEAGPDYASLEQTPPDLADGRMPAYTHDWGYMSEPDENGRSIALPRAKVIGGCSATNACVALRGSPADYDGWASAGNEGWSFADLLPHFRALESDLDFDDEWHGRSGPIPVRRSPASEMSPWSEAVVLAAASLGHDAVDDHNRPWAVGAGPAPANARDGVRVSTALAYLGPARGRANLEIRGGALVDRVRIEGGRATGVWLAGGELLEAETVVLAAGAYGSPAILMRSGVGPPDELSRLGIKPVVDLDRVGRNLMDHPIVSVDMPVRGPLWGASRFQTVTTLHSAGRDRRAAPDLQIFSSGPWDTGEAQVFGLVLSLLKPESRGLVRLRSADPEVLPAVEIGHLREEADRRRMAELLRVARELWRTPPLFELVAGAETRPGPAVADAELAHWALTSAQTCHHPCGTCALGTVVDSTCQVYGVERLYVADASVMPEIPSANTNVPTVMVGERVAALLRSRLRTPASRHQRRSSRR